MTLHLVDYHCHLDLYPDYKRAFQICGQDGIEVLSVTTTPQAWEKNIEFAQGFNNIRVGLGLHPQLVGEHYRQIELLEKLIHRARFIGEVGLDASPAFVKTLKTQIDVFERILKACSSIGGKVLSIHSVRTCKLVLDLIERWFRESDCRIVLHWFSGSWAEASRAIQLGCYFSVNHQMFHSNRFLEIFPKIPNERILTETDGPFTKTEGKPSRPQDIFKTIQIISENKGKTNEEISTQICSNLKNIENFD